MGKDDEWAAAVRALIAVVGVALAFVGGVCWVAAASSAPGDPVLGRSVVVARVSGKVLVKVGRSRSTVLSGRRVIPIGSTVDTTNGRVRLTSAANAQGARQSADFFGGAFVVNQSRGKALTTLTLSGGDFRTCTQPAADLSPVAQFARRRPRRHLWGSGTGSFGTSGNSASATVRGTVWLTEDACEGTSITDHRGHVATTSRDGAVQRIIDPGQTIEYRCARSGAPPVSTHYCVLVLGSDTTSVSNGRTLRSVYYGAGLSTRSLDDNYDLCVSGPRRRSCTTYPLQPPVDQLGDRLSTVVCSPDQGAGDYVISWRVRGVVLGSPLTYHAPISSPTLSPCTSSFGRPSVGSVSASLLADYKSVNRYSLPTAGTVQALSIYLTPTGISGQQALRGIVYADSGGAPGALLGTTNELTFRSTDRPDWYYLAFPTPFNLAPGSYWIGVIAGGQTKVAGLRYYSVRGSFDYNPNAYTSGPSDPFGPIAIGGAQVSLYAVYDVLK